MKHFRRVALLLFVSAVLGRNSYANPGLQAISTEFFQAGQTVFLFTVRCQATFIDIVIMWHFIDVTGFILGLPDNKNIAKAAFGIQSG